MYALNITEDGRILSACICLEGQEYNNKVENIPDGNITDYKFIDGEFVLDPKPEHEPEPEVLTPFDMLEAQVIYTAMMTDTLIGE